MFTGRTLPDGMVMAHMDEQLARYCPDVRKGLNKLLRDTNCFISRKQRHIQASREETPQLLQQKTAGVAPVPRGF